MCSRPIPINIQFERKTQRSQLPDMKCLTNRCGGQRRSNSPTSITQSAREPYPSHPDIIPFIRNVFPFSRSGAKLLAQPHEQSNIKYNLYYSSTICWYVCVFNNMKVYSCMFSPGSPPAIRAYNKHSKQSVRNELAELKPDELPVIPTLHSHKNNTHRSHRRRGKTTSTTAATMSAAATPSVLKFGSSAGARKLFVHSRSSMRNEITTSRGHRLTGLAATACWCWLVWSSLPIVAVVVVIFVSLIRRSSHHSMAAAVPTTSSRGTALGRAIVIYEYLLVEEVRTAFRVHRIIWMCQFKGRSPFETYTFGP